MSSLFLTLRKNSNFKIFRFILLVYLGWLISIYFIAYLGLSVLPTQDFYNKQLFYPNVNLDFWSRWSNWDGGGFRYIAEHGYIPRLTVFFPLYPILIKSLVILGINSLISGVIISLISSLVGLFFLYKLILLEFNEEVSRKTIFVLLAFPASFYLATIYSDALALAVSTVSLYLARKEKWLLASLFSSFAVITRPVGIATTVAILTLYLIKKNYKPKFDFLWRTTFNKLIIYFVLFYILLNSLITFSIIKNALISGVLITILQPLHLIIGLALSFIFLKNIGNFSKNLEIKKIFSLNLFYIVISPIPLVFYLYYQQINFGSMFTFLKFESSVWGRHLSLPWDGAIFAIKFIFSYPLRIGELSAHLHFRMLILIVNLICLGIAYLKLPLYLIVYFFISLLIPLLSGSLGDLMRFTLVNFPLFLSIALINNQMITKFYFFLSILLLTLFIILFINLYFFI